MPALEDQSLLLPTHKAVSRSRRPKFVIHVLDYAHGWVTTVDENCIEAARSAQITRVLGG